VPGYPRPRKVPSTRLSALAAVLGVPSPAATGDVAVTGVTHASAEVRAGDLYAALPGSRRHGGEFVEAARAAGAVAVLTDPTGAAAAAGAGLPALVVDDPRAVLGTVADLVYGQPTRELLVIGITGTAGKTSTGYLLESGLRAAGIPAGLIGTVETRLGDLVIDSARTTPEATDLHALFATAVERGVRAVAMEVSSHALVLGRVTGVRFAVGGFTNLGTDHLDFHADVEEYFAAKARLFDGRCAVEIVNVDDPAGRRLVHPETVTYSASGDPAAAWRAADVTGAGYAQRFTALGPGGVAVEAGVGLPGRHNVANALLAIASLVAVGVDPAVAAVGVAACPGVPGRLERVDAPGPVLGVVDYAHKPDAIVAVLAALRELVGGVSRAGSGVGGVSQAGSGAGGVSRAGSGAGGVSGAGSGAGRLICVLGAGGDRDRAKRPMMGAAAAQGAELVLVTDDNPRTEDPAVIRAEVMRGAAGAVEVPGRRAAIDEAVRRSRPGDVIAVLGKGHEREQEIAGRSYPFDDRTELAEALAARFAPAAGGVR
jgi:UDP-N-acetylmuramoyl-L-alanyl-D-glutamate--2,6-diaminopimelate ligase